MRYVYILLLATLQGCSLYHTLVEEEPPPEATLAQLGPVAIGPVGEPLPQMSLAELASLYKEILPLTDDIDTRLAVQHRLADIEMLSGEENFANSTFNDDFFDEAIAAYERLLEENPNNPANDQLLYQLSKAHELGGDSKQSLSMLTQLSANHPDSPYLSEAQFRLAESYFVAADYARADQAYTRVIESGEHSLYYNKSLYMHGWSKFKQEQYAPAVVSFTASLDQLMPENGRLESLARGDRELIEDSFRVLAITFNYLGGAESIASVYDELGDRDYLHLLYQELGDLYLDQERYRDSAEAYKAHTLRFPDSQVAQHFQIKVIAAYETGGFPKQVIEEKQVYVGTFGYNGDHRGKPNWSTRSAIDETLKEFIPELAQHFHARAQQVGRRDNGSAAALPYYHRAAEYYRMYVESFPLSPYVPEMTFLLAESQFEAQDYQSAIASYEQVAYQFIDYEKAVDAGYSAIHAYGKLPEHEGALPGASKIMGRISSELRFAYVFPSDSRAPGVLGHAASGLFEQAQYRQAIITATELVHWQPTPAVEITVPAWLVLAHSHFELQDFADAETAYQGALTSMVHSDERYTPTVELLAASIYKQAEEAVARGQHSRGAHEFARVLAVAPASKISINAQYDAAHNYIKSGDYVEANRLLVDFRVRYPDNPLTLSIPGMMISNYQQQGKWGEAARELDAIYAAEPDDEKRRSALYLAAQYYEKANQNENAILRYRSYAHGYEQPFPDRMEAMNSLARLYREDGQAAKERFWLNKIIVSHDAAALAQTERSVYLAADASSVIADDAYQVFHNLELKIPLKESLKKKKRAMGKAVDAYNRTNAYAVQQFVTLATYRLARIYQQLGIDLLASERPPNLDSLALEQYELLLEEQAFPFEEKAIAIYQTNTRRSWEGVYDQWVKQSFTALANLLPARYAKTESSTLLSEDIY